MTSRKDLAQIAVRLLAMFLFIQSLTLLVQSVHAFSLTIGEVLSDPTAWREMAFLALSIIPIAIWWLLCLALWRKSPKIAEKLTANLEKPGDPVLVHIEARDLPGVGLMLFGVWMLLKPLNDIGSLVALLAAMPRPETMGGQYPEIIRQGMVKVTFVCITYWSLGLLLIGKSRGLVNVLIRLRDLGLKKPTDTSGPITPHQDPPARSDG